MKVPFPTFLFLPVLLGGAMQYALAGDRVVYQGTLGNALVVMELEAPNAARTDYNGRYFYPRYGVDIPLQGQLAALDEAIPRFEKGEVIDESAADRDGRVFDDPKTSNPRISWQGKLLDGVYQGMWHDTRSNRQIPFVLKPVAHYDPDLIRPGSVEAVTNAITPGAGSGIAYDARITLRNAPYDFLKMQYPLQMGKEVLVGKVGYRMVIDTRTHFAYPRLTRHPDAAVLTRTNQLLEQRHWHMSLDALACAATLYTDAGPAAGSLGGYDQESISISYLTSTVMSVVESGSTYCGGAHPNNHYEPYTLDLRQGGYLDFNRLLPAWKAGEYGAEVDPALERFIVGKLKANAHKPGAEDDPECQGVLVEYLALEFQAPDKLAFDVSGIGHAMGVCLGPQLVLPLRDLKPVLRPGARRYLDLR